MLLVLLALVISSLTVTYWRDTSVDYYIVEFVDFVPFPSLLSSALPLLGGSS